MKPALPLTFEQVMMTYSKSAVWIEQKNNEYCAIGLYDGIEKDEGMLCCHFACCHIQLSMRVSHYGKTWRCWSKKPTSEQRKEIRWEAMNYG